MQNQIYHKVRRSVVYKKKHLENKDMDRQNQNEVLDDLASVTAKHQMMLHLKENAHYKEEDIIEELNLSSKSDEEENLIHKKDEAKSDEEIDKEFQDELNKDQTEDLSNKITPTVISTNPDSKKKFFELYKSEYNSKKILATDFESVYNSENLEINLSPSKNQFIRIYDDMMNDKLNKSAETLSELRIKFFEFVKMNPISIDIGDMIYRLGMKHLSLDPIDNKGAIQCFEHALQLYLKINDNMTHVLNAEKNTKSARKISDVKTGMDKSAVMINSPDINNKNMNTISQYKYKANKIRMFETLKKLADCYITEMDTANAHKNILAAVKHCIFLFGENSKEVADCFFKNAYFTQLEHKWKEATEIYNRSLAVYQNVFRYTNIHFTKISHIEIADCYFKLGLIKEKQKNFNLSMEYYNMALVIYKNHFKGDTNEECALTMFNIGLLYEIQEMNDKASKFYNQVRDVYAKIKPDSQDYIDILIKSANLSLIFKKYEEALTDLIQALTKTVEKNKCESFEELLEMVLVDSGEYQNDIYYHFADLADICFLLSKIYSVPELNKHQEGFETLKILLELMPPHQDFIEGTDIVLKKLLENLNEKNYKAEWEKDIIECIKQFISKMDLHVEENKRNFEREELILEQSEENIDKAEQQSVNSQSDSHDISQSDSKDNAVDKKRQKDEESILFVTKVSYKTTFFITKTDWLQTLGKNCTRLKLYKTAIELYLKCIVYLENVEDNADNKNRVCDLMNQIAMDYTSLTCFESAKVFFEKTLEMRIKLHSKDDIRIASSYNNLAISHNRLGDNFKALEYWQLGMEIKKNVVKDEEDPRIAKDYYNFSVILFSMQEYDKAIQYMIDALYIFDKKLGKNSRFSADACLFLGESYKIINNNVSAVNYCTRAMTYYIDNFQEEHYNTIKSRLLFAICLSLTSKYDRAIVIFKAVIEKFIDQEHILRTSLFIEGIYEYAKCLDWTNKYGESLKYFEFFLENANEDTSEERLKKVAAKIAQLVI